MVCLNMYRFLFHIKLTPDILPRIFPGRNIHVTTRKQLSSTVDKIDLCTSLDPLKNKKAKTGGRKRKEVRKEGRSEISGFHCREYSGL
jgi:hypothetical protein